MISIDFCNIDAADIHQLNSLAKWHNLPELPEDMLTPERIQKYRRTQFFLRSFFKGCADGKPDLDMLNDLFVWFNKNNQNLRFQPSDDPFAPEIVQAQPLLDVSECAWTEVITSFISGQGHRFKNVRECPHCRKVFIGDNSRATFCTQSHGTLFRRHKGERTDRGTLKKFATTYYGEEFADSLFKARK